LQRRYYVLQKFKLPNLKDTAMRLSIGSVTLWLEVATLVAATAAFYVQDLIMIFADSLNSEATSYLLVIPFILVYLVYRKRKMLKAAMADTQAQTSRKRMGILSGILMCATAVLLYWYGSSTFTPLEYHMLTLPLFVSGLILILFNAQTLRHAAFPLVFLFFLVPPTLDIFNTVGSALAVVSSRASNGLVNLVGVHTSISYDFGAPMITVMRPDGTGLPFTVDLACSGIYSLIGFLVFAAFIVFIVRDKAWKKAALFVIGLPLVYALNIFRITGILLIGYQWGEQLPIDAFHAVGGWILIFLGTLIILTISEKGFKTHIFTPPQPKTACPACNPHYSDKLATYCSGCGRLLKYPKTNSVRPGIAKIAAIALTAVLLVSIQAPVLVLTKGPAQVLVQTAEGEQGNSQMFPQIPGFNLTYLYRNTYTEQLKNENLSLMYLYSPIQEGQEPVEVALEVASSKANLHDWKLCRITYDPLIHGEPRYTQLDLRDVQILQNPPIYARYLAFNDTSFNQTELVLYWYTTSVLTINNSSQTKQVMISLETWPDNVTATEAQLLPMAKAIAEYWQPLQTWGSIALFLSDNGLTLAATTAALVVAIIIFSLFETQRRRRQNLAALDKLSRPNQQLIEAIRKTEKSSTANFNRIREAYQQTAGQTISDDRLQQELLSLEKTGLIKQHLMSNQDSPVQAWRTDINGLRFRKGQP
jgi:exosortase